MAYGFQNLTVSPGLEFVGGTTTRKVAVCSFETTPSLIYVEFRIPKADFNAQAARAAALGWANIYESVNAEQWVGGVQWAQEPQQNGQLLDVVVITVLSTSGNSSDELTVPVVQLGPKLHQAQITALHDELDALEAP